MGGAQIGYLSRGPRVLSYASACHINGGSVLCIYDAVGIIIHVSVNKGVLWQWFGRALCFTLPPGGLEANCCTIPSVTDA